MAAHIVPTGRPIFEPQEVILDNAADVKPTDLPVGSVAYTGDLLNMWVFTGTTWKKVGGG